MVLQHNYPAPDTRPNAIRFGFETQAAPLLTSENLRRAGLGKSPTQALSVLDFGSMVVGSEPPSNPVEAGGWAVRNPDEEAARAAVISPLRTVVFGINGSVPPQLEMEKAFVR